VRFVYDQHDLCPELYRAKFPDRDERSRLLRILLWLERNTYRLADVLVSPNESYAAIGRERGGIPAERSFVVRSAPRSDQFVPKDPKGSAGSDRADPTDPTGRTNGRRFRHLVGYIGIMGNQDGVDLLVRAAHHIVNEQGRDDVGFVLIGGGDERAKMVALAAELGLSENVEFTGRMSDLDAIVARLAETDVCACPDPENPFNDRSSMNKIVEYMALGKAVVGFDLTESRRTLGDGGGILVGGSSASALGEALLELIDDPERRARIGRANRRRYLEELCWERQVPHLFAAYRQVGLAPDVLLPVPPQPSAAADADPWTGELAPRVAQTEGVEAASGAAERASS